MDEVKSTIREFILVTHLPGESAEDLSDTTPLMSSGILDSLAALGLINFIEQQYRVELDIYDTSVERFDTIEQIAAVVEAKQPIGGRR